MVENESFYEESKLCNYIDGGPKHDSFYNKDGLLLRNYSWIVKNAIGIIILVHGLYSHARLGFLRHNINIISNHEAVLNDSDNYYIYKDSWIEEFNKNGYSVYGLDMQGHGESDGYNDLKHHVNNFDDFVYDLLQYVMLINSSLSIEDEEVNTNIEDDEQNVNITIPPIYLIGFSMGGNIVLRALEILGKSKELQKRLNIKGCISLSPMISVNALGSIDSRQFNYFFKPLIKMVSCLFTLWRLPFMNKIRFPNNSYVNDIHFLDKVRFDKGMTFKLAYELLRGMQNLSDNINDIPEDISVYIIHSLKDCVCYYGDTVSFFDRLYNNNKELLSIDNVDHVIVMEPGNEEVLKKIISWLSEVQERENLIHIN
ncbi:acyl-CoA synthetase [Plasmodium reichenowi]|uniref:Acyl-CoA synthetase n=1 Tax=Plasmodium reichenowi TaxID=5854 RepID=A0A151L2X9_PLARE|nr:acyl-CoA synthetase [Plasmodium reichenowi]KYN93310.1 acyl-CoA synthetase [Plasmodium reichenowi]